MKFKDPELEKGSFLSISLLILSGELIFLLPYVLARVFRPTFLEVFNLTNLELGSLFSIYGTVAILSYLYGGVISDKFQPKILIAISLFFTSFGGIVLSTYPSYWMLQILWGYWGFTTVFLFWGAMIKATRVWGGSKNQGEAFGLLDGGRGLVAASMGTLGVLVFSLFLTNDIEIASLVERKNAFKYVILFSSFIVFLTGILVILYMESSREGVVNKSSSLFPNIRSVIKIQSVWLIMFIIIAAYVGYKVTDIYSLYASDVMRFDNLEAANIGSLQLYLRPLVCLLIALFADKKSYIHFIIIGFIVMLVGALIFSLGIVQVNMNYIFFFSLIVVATGTYAIRALYFSLMQEGRIPLVLTGTAVGVISVVGYTPDIFASPMIGYLLDTYPGIIGHQYVFAILVLFSIVGLWASIKFSKLVTSFN
ncbi:MFS transporter [Flavobacteriaceae bacterium]|jgi:sugar phosphate permease|nr:MFS transporter [Flavobacteriaceae bacterium]|tara:strand:+ start:1461 stop:2729 length:1269 start_codon:yes stop_codon:yes gene_type:complete